MKNKHNNRTGVVTRADFDFLPIRKVSRIKQKVKGYAKSESVRRKTRLTISDATAELIERGLKSE